MFQNNEVVVVVVTVFKVVLYCNVQVEVTWYGEALSDPRRE